jgi:type IV secretory pathway VirB10-like protein
MLPGKEVKAERNNVFRKYRIVMVAVAAAATGGIVWAGAQGATQAVVAQESPAAISASANPSTATSPEVPVPGPGASSEAPAAPAAPSAPSPEAPAPAPAAPEQQPAQPENPQRANVPADVPVDVPSVAVNDCASLQASLTEYQETAKSVGPTGFRMLLVGLDNLEGMVGSLASSDQQYEPVMQELSDVRREWSSALSAHDAGITAEADKASQEALASLQTARDSLTCTS